MRSSIDTGAWPTFSYEAFKPTEHLLHMLMQAIGKLKLLTPFEPKWSNVGLWVTTQGISTGLIPYQNNHFSVSVNFITHQVVCATASGEVRKFNLCSISVASLITILFKTLDQLGVEVQVNPKPQEVPHPILFYDDTASREYLPELTQAWWRILVNTQRVMQRYHAKFLGNTPPIALMWGTLDIRDVRFNGEPVEPTGVNGGYLRRNAMDEEQVEAGWWAGNELYPHAAFYSFTYPKPPLIEQGKIEPDSAKWNDALGEFLLDYDAVQSAKNPDAELLQFLESSYNIGAEKAHWNPKLIGIGKPA